jgi:hypothetical protein
LSDSSNTMSFFAYSNTKFLFNYQFCHDPSLGLSTKAKEWKSYKLKVQPKSHIYIPRNVREWTHTHKTHHSPDLGEATSFLLIVLFVLGHGSCTQMSFCPRIPRLWIPRFPKLGFPRLWRTIMFCENL